MLLIYELEHSFDVDDDGGEYDAATCADYTVLRLFFNLLTYLYYTLTIKFWLPISNIIWMTMICENKYIIY